MKPVYRLRTKMLLGIVSALLLALVLQPAVALASGAATITYKSEGDGYVTPTSDSLDYNYWENKLTDIGEEGDTEPRTGEYVYITAINILGIADANDGSEFAYWTADVDVYIPRPTTTGDNFWVRVVKAGTKIPTAKLGDTYATIYAARDTTFTAHFTKTAFTLTYQTDGNGTVEPASEQVQDGNSPAGPTKLTPKDGYEFSHWTANVDVTLADGVIYEGNAIAADELTQILVDDDITFTAHFKETGSDPVTPDSDPDDSSDKVKPADGTSDKVLPKTGSTLPGVGVAIALCAGSVITAGVLFARKRSSQE